MSVWVGGCVGVPGLLECQEFMYLHDSLTSSSDEEEDDEMDFSGVKTVNLQVSSPPHLPTCEYM